jgi:hypothetical protein
MSHPQQQEYIARVKEKFPQYFDGKRVLEVGSLNINGTLRDFFTNSDYTGVDLDEGPGVDVICEGQNLEYPDNSFDVAISAECFEHNPHWAETFINMTRMSSDIVIFTCASTGREEHGTSNAHAFASPFTVAKGWDYYKNLTQEDFETMPLDDMFTEYVFSTNDFSHDIYFYGFVRK